MSQRKFKVKVIQISLKNNKLAKSGDEVSESQLMRNANDLVKEGFIAEIGGKKATKGPDSDILSGNVTEASEKIASLKAEELEDVLKRETEGQNRKGVLKAIEERKAELEKSK